MSVYESLEQVKDRESFLSFIKDLAWDSANNKDEWQNCTIADYLESIAAWIEDSDNEELTNLDFKEVAKLFYVGKIYEWLLKNKSLDIFCEKFSSRVKDKYVVHTKDYRSENGINYIPVYMVPFL